MLAVGGAAYALLQSLVVPALPTLQEDLGTTPAGVTWIFTAYLLAASVATPIAGRLGDMFGKKRTLVVVLLGVCAGTFIAALATTLPVMIGARLIQGLGGAIFPLAFGIIRDEFPRERVAGGIALISGLLGIGGGLGIVLSGPILAHLSYHWLFWLPFGGARGDRGRDDDHHPRVTGSRARQHSLAGRAAALALADLRAARDQRGAHLGLDLHAHARADRRRRRARTRVGQGRGAIPRPARRHADDATAGSLDDEPGGLPDRVRDVQRIRAHPQFVQTPDDNGYGFGSSVTQAGLFLIPSTLMMLISAPFAGRLSGRYGSKVPLVLGSAITMLAFVVLAVAHDAHWQVYLASLLLGIGVGFAFASMANLIVEAVRPDQTGVATGMNAVMRTIGGAIGGQVAASILSATLLADGYPSEGGYTLSFTIMAAALAGSIVASLAVPARKPVRARQVSLADPQASYE